MLNTRDTLLTLCALCHRGVKFSSSFAKLRQPLALIECGMSCKFAVAGAGQRVNGATRNTSTVARIYMTIDDYFHTMFMPG